MAIAYFIPDQSKLLAGNTSAQSHQQANTSAAPGSTPPMSNGDNCSNDSTQFQQQQQTQNHNFRANITIPLPTYVSEAPENVGCWDLITQVFCYTLRFCHETRLNPAVIEISFEFNGGLQQQTTNSNNSSNIGTGSADVAAASTGTITARSAPCTTTANQAVGNATSMSDIPQNAVASVRLENRASVTSAALNNQTAERGPGARSHRSAGRRSAASRRN